MPYSTLDTLPKKQYDNLGGFGNYEQMRKLYLPEVKHRYIYEPKNCCNTYKNTYPYNKHRNKCNY
jgi:hypothetical protein